MEEGSKLSDEHDVVEEEKSVDKIQLVAADADEGN